MHLARFFCFLAVLSSIQDGIGTLTAQSDDSQQADEPAEQDADITNSAVAASPACQQGNVSLRVEASDETKAVLSEWLVKDSAKLIFIYFDLVVGNVTYHPGSCPSAGKSAIDAQTPLAWVLTNGVTSLGSHSFAHAYLTLPISYPRIYSMGILEGLYIGNMYQDRYRINVSIAVNENASREDGVDEVSCWMELNKTEKATVMLRTLQSIVDNLAGSNGTNAWRMCYSDPVSSDVDLPMSVSPLIQHTPLYVCQDESGTLVRLERDNFLKGLYIFFQCLSLAMIALQLYILRKGMLATYNVRKHGEPQSRLLTVSGRTIREGGFFNKSQIPFHATIVGLLSSDIVLGQRAFARLKMILFWGFWLFMFTVWPNLLVQSVLTPTSDVAKLGVSSAETFGRRLPCKANIPSGASLSLVTTGFYSVIGPILAGFVIVAFIFFTVFIERDTSSLGTITDMLIKGLSDKVANRLSSIFLRITTYLRIGLSFPSIYERPHDAIPVHHNGRGSSSLAFVIGQLLFWLFVLPVTLGVFVTASVCAEILKLTGFLVVFEIGVTLLELALLIILGWFPSVLVVLFLYIQGSELLAFMLLSCVSLYIKYPLPTFLTLSWLVALVAQTKMLIHDYRLPLLAVQQKFAEKFHAMAERYITLDYDNLSTGSGSVGMYLMETVCNDVDSPKMNWERFLNKAEDAWYKTSLRLLTWKDQTFSDLEYRHRTGESRDMLTECEERHNGFVLKWMDVRDDWEVNKKPALLNLQRLLWLRFFKGLLKLFVSVVLFFSLLMFMLAFHSLWKLTDSSPKDTSYVFLTIIVIPLYTVIQTKLNPSALNEDEEILVKKTIDAELEKCFRASITTTPVSSLFGRQHLSVACCIGGRFAAHTSKQ